MAGLQSRLNEFSKAFESGSSPHNATQDAIEKMHQATTKLKAGIEERALKAGDRAPSSLYSIRITFRCPRTIF